MRRRSLATPARWTALGSCCLLAMAVACTHTEPFSDSQESEEPFDPSPPIRLTLGPYHDGQPTWLPDGSGILYSAHQGDRVDSDVCLAELPTTGGRHRRLICNLPGDKNTTDAAHAAAPIADGRVAFLSAGNGSLGGDGPVFLNIALLPTLDAFDAQMVFTLPATPPGGTRQDFADFLSWLDDERLVYTGLVRGVKRDCPPCKLDTFLIQTEVTTLNVVSGTAAAVPGTTLATGVAPMEDGSAIVYTLANDSRIYRRTLGSGQVTVLHDFGPAGIARDVHAAGGKVVAVVGGRVAFAVHPVHEQLGTIQWDSGGVIHVVEPGSEGSVALDTPGRLYRRPALSPDGTRIVVEGYPLIITGPPEAPDTTVGGSGDLYLFGGL